jgi:hypothetical protein
LLFISSYNKKYVKVILFNMAGVLLAFAASILSACQTSNGLEENNVVPFGEDVALTTGMPVRLTDKADKADKAANDIIINLHRITESRCPEGVNCITAGNVMVQLMVSADNVNPQTVSMCLGDCIGDNGARRIVETDSMDVRVAQQGYKIYLKAVEPYPTANVGQQEQQAIVQVVPVK